MRGQINLEDIIEIRQRSGAPNRARPIFEFSAMRQEFQENFLDGDDASDFMLALFPIRIVTLLEVYIRSAVQELVDGGQPFEERMFRNAKELKFTPEVVRAIHGRTVTLGEIASQSISLNNVAAIVSIFNQLLDDDFKKLISVTKDRWDIEIRKGPNEPILRDVEGVFRSLQETFDNRHILVHELPERTVVDAVQVNSQIDAAIKFVNALDALIWNVIDPNAPLTQADMNKNAYEQYNEDKETLEALFVELEDEIFEEQTERFRKAKDAWYAYLDAESKFAASSYDGGSMQPLVHAISLSDLTKRKIEQVSQTLDELRSH